MQPWMDVSDEMFGQPVYVGERNDTARDAHVIAAALVGFFAGKKAAAVATDSPAPASKATIDLASAALLMRARLGSAHKPLQAVPAEQSTLVERMKAACGAMTSGGGGRRC